MNDQSFISSHLDKKKFTYGLVGLLAGSAITVLLMTYKLPIQNHEQRVANPLVPAAVAIPKLTLASRSEQYFIEQMVPHHEQAIAMTELALSRTKRPEIKALAAAIRQTQIEELQQMQTCYRKLYGISVPNFARRQERNFSQTESAPTGMVRNANFLALKNAPDFDQEFLRQMIPHHQIEILLAAMVLYSAEHPEMQALVQSIIENQQAEIEQMQQWYQTWYQ